MEKEIKLKTVERVTTAKGTKMVFVTSDDSNGVEHKMSAFDEIWNENWKPGDTVSVLIKVNGQYKNLYPTAKEANTARPPREKTDREAINECHAMLVTLLNMAVADKRVKEAAAAPVASPYPADGVNPDDVPF